MALFPMDSQNEKERIALGHYLWFRQREEIPGGGVLPYMGYIGMCCPKGYGFSAVLVINRVSILADLGHKLGMVFVL